MKSKIAFGIAVAVVGLGLVLAGCGDGSSGKGGNETAGQDGGFKLPSDPGNFAPHKAYEAMKIPAENPITVEKGELGWVLFFDERLSGDGKRSCYGCHLNEKGLSDGRKTALGAYDKVLGRNSPVLWNIGYHPYWYWDGRASTLEAQAGAAWKGGNMGAGKEEGRLAAIIKELNEDATYKDLSKKAFNGPLTEENIPQALASYMRTIVSQTTPYDKFRAGDKSALSESAQRGHDLFMDKEKTGCVNCHSGVFFTDFQFHNVGVGFKDGKFADLGRGAKVDGDELNGAFKTPTLRDVGDSGPYFHDGSVATLEEVVKYMLSGGNDNPQLDKKNLQKRTLTDAEIKDLVTFLREGLDETATLQAPK